jgi:hypothetical protein
VKANLLFATLGLAALLWGQTVFRPPGSAPVPAGSSSYVKSFGGRTGAITPKSGDYTADQITGLPAGSSGDLQYNNSGKLAARSPQGDGARVQMTTESTNPDEYTIGVYDASGNVKRNLYGCR